MTELSIHELSLGFSHDRQMLVEFLAKHHLNYEDDIEAAFGVFDSDDNLTGCGCCAGNLLKCFAVDESLRGQNALGSLVSRLVENRFEAGHYDLFVITRPKNKVLFTSCGFYPLAETEAVLMLENKKSGLDNYYKKFLAGTDTDENVGCIVMNCNPFTLGHRSLVEYAVNNCDEVIIFAVQEDRSIFPFSDRFSLIKQGVKDMKGVSVISGGDYIISNATFPTYFIKGTDELAAQTKLDATVFATRIAPALNITVRFVGEEPTDKTTLAYNRAMREVFANNGIELKVIPREQKGHQVVSASTVRKALSEDDWETVYRMVPKSTLVYLKSPEGQAVIRKIKMTEAFKQMEAEEKAKAAEAKTEK